MDNRSSLRDLGIALSLANVCLLRMWTSILAPPSVFRAAYAAAIANTAILTLLLWVVARVARRLGTRRVLEVGRYFLVLAAVACLPGVARAIWPAVETTGWFRPARASYLAVSAVAILGLSAVGKGPILSAMTCRVLLALLPATVVTVGQSASRLAGLAHRAAARITTGPATTHRGPATEAARADTRVVILMLDEFDYWTAFESPSAPRLQALDQLRNDAVWASRAYPPAAGTNQSIPSYLTGKLVPHAWQTAEGGLDVIFAGTTEPVSMAKHPTILTALREQGMRSTVIGHSLPYTRLFQRDAFCLDPRGGGAGWVRVANHMVLHAGAVAADSPLPAPGCLRRATGTLERGAAVRAYGDFAAAAERAGADPTRHFTLLHCPVPHEPCIYDRTRGQLTAAGGRAYIDNLVLADRTVGRVRAAMEAAGEWERTTVVVISDHWWRDRPADTGPPDHRVPFALKLAGRRAGIHYPRAFNTVLLHDLLMALFGRELQKPADVVRWLDRHRTFGESPLTRDIGPKPSSESASEAEP